VARRPMLVVRATGYLPYLPTPSFFELRPALVLCRLSPSFYRAACRARSPRRIPLHRKVPTQTNPWLSLSSPLPPYETSNSNAQFSRRRAPARRGLPADPHRGEKASLSEIRDQYHDRHRGVVMKASPSSRLKVAEPHLLLELLIVVLDAPAQLGVIDRRKLMSSGSVESQYLLGSFSSFGHSISSHSSGRISPSL
jgi:hypothetical protein